MAGRSRGLTSSDSVMSLHRCVGDIRVMCNDVAMVVLKKAMYTVKKSQIKHASQHLFITLMNVCQFQNSAFDSSLTLQNQNHHASNMQGFGDIFAAE